MEIELNIYTYTLLAVIVSLLLTPLIFYKEPDIHPIALLHQSQPSNIRQPRESAVYRNAGTPHGSLLKTGLALPGEKSWQTRDGDLRDIWNAYVEKGPGEVLSVKGTTVTKVPVDKITKWIHILGSYIAQSSSEKRIAVHLPNDIENLVVSFACAFYDLTLILVPYPSEVKVVRSILSKTNADYLVTAAGVLALKELQVVQSLKNIIYVVEPASRDLDWNTPPGSRLHTRTFHDLISGDAQPVSEPPKDVDVDKAAIVVTYTPMSTEKLDVTEFSTRNIIAAIGAQLTSLPPAERFTTHDTFLPLDCLSILYPRILTYSALFCSSLLALNSASGAKCNLATASAPISPTIIVASSHALLNLIRHTQGNKMELWHNLISFFQSRTLSSGRIPRGNLFTRLNDYARPTLGNPHNLRLLFTHEIALTADTQALNSPDLNDLRQFLATRVIYALCSPRVAGAICAQNPYDYRYEAPEHWPSRKKGIGRKCTHFGPPLGGAEVWVRDAEGYKSENGEGAIWVRGPVVPGWGVKAADKSAGKAGQIGVGVVGKWRDDGCLEFM